MLLAALFPILQPISQANAATSTSFSYAGSAQTWTVPAGVTSIKVSIKGASGAYSNGGFGESISATISVTPGETLQVNVGQSGAAHVGATTAPATFGGGGLGSMYSGSGGGASDIRVGAFGLSDRILVAGGGGSGGTGSGGNAGFTSGSSGTSGYSGATGGSGGTQISGGAGGTGASACGNQSGSAGALGLGGAGATASAGGGGGGGGYYGGGGGGSGCNDSGGGGGSSYAHPIRASLVTYSNVGTRTHGSVEFSYTIALQTTVALSVVDGVNSATKGTTKELRATVTSTSGGRVTFLVNGKRIPGCISRLITTTLDCSWKPTIQQSYELSAIFSPSTSTDIPSSTKLSNLPVTKRSGNR